MSNKNKVAKSAAMIVMFTLMSKGLGFLREVLIAYRYGSGMETDTYFVAMTATVIIMGTLGSALNTTLIPIFSEVGEKRNKFGKLEFLNNILNITIFLTIILAILAFVFAPVTIKILAKDFVGEQFDLAVKLNRIGLPIVVFLGITYVLSGFLHSNEIFGPHAIMGIPYNFVFLTYLIFLSKNRDISTLMVVSVIAASTQFLIQVPAVRHQGYRHSFNINLRDPYLRKAIVLILPVLLGSAVHQINVIVDKTLASGLEVGSISALTYASRINDLVITVFVMAITTVVFPMLSKAFSQDDRQTTKRIFNQGVNLILLITIPATIGLLLLAEPLVKLFFEGGAFGEKATYMTSGALVFYSIGLVGAALRQMLNKVFYSLQDTKTPMINGIISVGINIVLNLILVGRMEHKGLALATSISAIVTTIMLFIDLRKKLGPLGITQMVITFVKTLIASLVMGVIVYLIYFRLGALVGTGKLVQMLMLVLSVAVGVIAYFFLTLILRIEETKVLVRQIAKR